MDKTPQKLCFKKDSESKSLQQPSEYSRSKNPLEIFSNKAETDPIIKTLIFHNFYFEAFWVEPLTGFGKLNILYEDMLKSGKQYVPKKINIPVYPGET